MQISLKPTERITDTLALEKERINCLLGLALVENPAMRMLADSGNSETTGVEVEDFRRRVAELESEIDSTRDQEEKAPLSALCERFQLTCIERDIVLLSFFLECDDAIRNKCVDLHGDASLACVSRYLVREVFSSHTQDSDSAEQALSRSGTLFSEGILLCDPDLPAELYPRLMTPIFLAPAILHFLSGIDSMDELVVKYCRRRQHDYCNSEEETQRVGDSGLPVQFPAMPQEAGKHKSMLLHLWGPPGAGKLSRILAEVCSENSQLFWLAFDEAGLSGVDFFRLIERLVRHCKLHGLPLIISHADRLCGSGKELERERLWLYNCLVQARIPLIITTEKRVDFPYHVHRDMSVHSLEVPGPDYDQRIELWQECLRAAGIDVSPVDIELLASSFRFTRGVIQNSVQAAVNNGRVTGQQVGLKEIQLGCRSQCNQVVSGMARKLETLFSWNDLVLPDDTIAQLREACLHFRKRYQIFDTWGFAASGSAEVGLKLLFSGPSGTGKTLAASVLAAELGLTLYRIDLSGIVSKYIGDTEKNLERIFDEAESAHSILFFDEADALFGKRSEVNSSHDRYANIEVGYLLQKMEECSGVTILASNLAGNMDEAFSRRLNFIIDFPLPNEEHRLGVWRKAFPDKATIDSEVDFQHLAGVLKVSAANIKNIALHAAFLASEDGNVIKTKHIMHAARREYEKEGKTLM